MLDEDSLTLPSEPITEPQDIDVTVKVTLIDSFIIIQVKREIFIGTAFRLKH